MDLCSDEELVSAVSTCHLVAALDTDLIEQIKHIIYIHIFFSSPFLSRITFP